MERIRLYNDDCLNTFKLIEDKTIDLILIDPPYNISKAEWDKWKTVEAYVEFMGSVFKECERVLKDNGSFYFFHNDFLQMVELQNWINKNTKFIFKSLITINKSDNNYVKDLYGSMNHFRNYLNINEYCLFFTFQDETGLTKIKTDMNNFKELREYSKKIQGGINKKIKEINAMLGHRKAEHFFYHSSTQWELCTEETYNELIEKFEINKLNFFKPYESLRQECEELRQEYEKQRYTFNGKDGAENNLTYTFRKEKKYKHPTQKPVKLMEDIIKISSNENDLVLDCFMGSGSTGVACVNTNRNFIGIEKEEKYFNIAKERIEKASNISFF